MAIMNLFRPAPVRAAAARAYQAIVERARTAAFYRDHGVPDTLDGRFELITLHAFLVLERLCVGPGAERFSQALFDSMFADLDRGLREMGTGDLSVGKQVKLMATAFYGRAAAYRAGLAGTADLGDALARNLLGTIAQPAPQAIGWFVTYLRDQTAALRAVDIATITSGVVPFGVLNSAENQG